MSNPTQSPIETLALSKASKFRTDYVNLSRSIFGTEEVKNGLVHAGEFGRYREQLVRDLLTSYLPGRIGLGDGFLASPHGSLSTQLDVILYEKDATPTLEVAGGRVIFPVETCVGVGEAKSEITFLQLQEALQKLKVSKKMRADLRPADGPIAPPKAAAETALLKAGDSFSELMESLPIDSEEALKKLSDFYFTPEVEVRNNLVTFLICERIKWPEGQGPDTPQFAGTLKKLYPETTDFHLRHNSILSLEDGLLSYFSARVDPSGVESIRRIPRAFPTLVDGRPSGWRWLRADESNQHVLTFAAELAFAASDTFVYQFNPKSYSRSLAGFDFDFIPFG